MEQTNTKPEYKVDIFTGIRSTGGLTVANYLGAVRPLLELAKDGRRPMVFVANLHAMTDREPSEAFGYSREIVVDYIALGLDPAKTDIFLQSDIKSEIALMTLYLLRLISVAELIKVPTLKDKLKGDSRPETANALLANYPVMMAADILAQRAHFVPVGEDQRAHLEVTLDLARRFNSRYAEIFPMVEVQKMRMVKILGLRGDGKMSKTTPDRAIFLTDTAEEAAAKIKTAETALPGEMTAILESHFVMAEGLAQDADTLARIQEIKQAHLAGGKVMADFKAVLTEVVLAFLKDFQAKRAELLAQPEYLDQILVAGAAKARANAQETIAQMEKAMGIS